jgi:sec-independent protein translocase protein TatA
MNLVILLMLSGYEIAIILAVVVLLFGGKKIPELMRGLGKGMKEFKNATSEVDDIKKEIDNTASDIKNTKPETQKGEPTKKTDNPIS